MHTCGKPMPIPPFDASTVTREELVAWVVYWWPSGSGPLGMMQIIVAMHVQIAELRGFARITLADVEALSHADALAYLQKKELVSP
jgi:hypothetical protein